MAQRPDHDVIIVGGGPVGCALALGLAAAQRSVLLLDAAPEPAAASDPRSLALSYGSRLILERLSVWGEIAPVTDIRTIHISHRGGFGSAVLSAADVQTPALGYVAGYVSVQRAFRMRLQSASHLLVRAGARAMRIEDEGQRLRVAFEHEGRDTAASASLAVIADGGALTSQLAQMQVHDYKQSAVVCNIATSRPHQHTAFERFTQDGPLALLPLDSGYALVWTVSPEYAAELCAASADGFLERLQDTFGMRAGSFLSVSDRAAFPLTLRVANTLQLDRVVLIGNAAQALHPVAGQGLNLGLRDAFELAQHLCDVDGDVGAPAVVAHFRRQRQYDRRASVLLTDAMVRLFSNRDLALRWLRGCGLTFLDCLPPAKRKFMEQMIFGPSW